MLSQYEKNKMIFQTNCRFYRQQRKDLVEMKMKYPGIDTDTSSFNRVYDDNSTLYAAHRYTYLMQEVEWVDNIFRNILNKYGDLAYRMLYGRFIEHRTQEDVAQELGMTRRMLQYEEDKILKELLRRNEDGQKSDCIPE